MRRLKKLLKAFDTGEVELEDFDRSIESRFGHMKHADSYILIEETQEKIKEIQGKEGNGLKTGQKLPPFPFIIFIKERW